MFLVSYFRIFFESKDVKKLMKWKWDRNKILLPKS